MQKWNISNGNLKLWHGNQGATISKIVEKELLTKRYWDYLAWPIYSLNKEKVLMLGLGAGTVIQLLNKWGWSGQFDGVDINKELVEGLREQGYLNYENLNIFYEDAEKFIQETKNKYDAIIIDVYNHKEPINNLYSEVCIQKFKEILNPKGILLFHCIDPTSKYILFDLASKNKRIPSFSYTVATLMEGNFKYVYNFPLTTSSLVFVSNEDLDFSKEIEGEKPIRWLNKFFLQRCITNDNASRYVTKLDFPLTYEDIHRPHQEFLKSLHSSFSSAYADELLNIFNNNITTNEPYGNISCITNDLYCGIPEEIQRNFNLFMKVSRSQESPELLPYMVQEYLKALPYVKLKYKKSLLSHAYALVDEWENAITVLS